MWGETVLAHWANLVDLACGLFMGAIGKDRVFIVCDRSVEVKIPSDFAGITLAYYDGCRINDNEGESAVRTPSEQIAREIR